ncbi:MAG: hypothetical protein H6704_03405 [Myxococcales bacterium]|nr:hypothetical protein [Myxococcales bacterium]
MIRAFGDAPRSTPSMRNRLLVIDPSRDRYGRAVAEGVVVVEAQLSENPLKRFSWPAYVGSARFLWRCPVIVLVIAPDPRVAEWARQPIELGAGSVIRPVVLDPHDIPRVIEPETARARPELAVLSALMHKDHGADIEVVFAGAVAADAVAAVDYERGAVYYDLVTRDLDAVARAALEAIMRKEKHTFTSQFAREYYGKLLAENLEEGELLGRRHALVSVLDARGLRADEAQAARIDACTDIDQLDAWLRRAVSASSLDDVLGDDA